MGLRDAVVAKTLPLPAGIQGAIRLRSGRLDGVPRFEGVVVASQAELAAVAARHGWPADTFAPASSIDFKRDVGLLSIFGPGADPRPVAFAPLARAADAHRALLGPERARRRAGRLDAYPTRGPRYHAPP